MTKRIITIIASIVLVLGLFVICGYVSVKSNAKMEENQKIIKKVEQLQNENDFIDEELSNIMKMYSDGISKDELLSFDETINEIEEDISKLKQDLEEFNANEEVVLEYDSILFDKYNSAINKIREWREEQIESHSSKSKQKSEDVGEDIDDIGSTFLYAIENAYNNAAREIQLSEELANIYSYQPNYSSVIESLK